MNLQLMREQSAALSSKSELNEITIKKIGHRGEYELCLRFIRIHRPSCIATTIHLYSASCTRIFASDVGTSTRFQSKINMEVLKLPD